MRAALLLVALVGCSSAPESTDPVIHTGQPPSLSAPSCQRAGLWLVTTNYFPTTTACAFGPGGLTRLPDWQTTLLGARCSMGDAELDGCKLTANDVCQGQDGTVLTVVEVTTEVSGDSIHGVVSITAPAECAATMTLDATLQ